MFKITDEFYQYFRHIKTYIDLFKVKCFGFLEINKVRVLNAF